MIGGQIQIKPFSDLIFVYAIGCDACEAAEPELEKFMSAHRDFMVLRVRSDGPYPARLGLRIKATPTYLLRHGGNGFMHVGAMTSKDIESWIESVSDGSEEER